MNVFADLGDLGHIGPIDLAFGPDGNLYVTGFDNGVSVRIDGATGAAHGGAGTLERGAAGRRTRPRLVA